MEHIIFEQLKNELVKGGSEKGHPFRFFSFATVDIGNKPQQRTVVLRKTSPELHLFFYTDKRSSKLEQLHTNSHVCALFYHPEKMIQLKVEGKATVVDDTKTLQSLWSEVPLKSRKDYTTQKAPGSRINNPENLEYLNAENHFCAIELTPVQIEYLRLANPNHIRVSYTKKKDDWKGTFLVP